MWKLMDSNEASIDPVQMHDICIGYVNTLIYIMRA